MTLIERLRDLHKQATVERSHYYVGKCALDAADRIEALEAALREAERFVSYLANETDGCFAGSGTPTTCLVMIRAALAPEQNK